MAKKNLKEEVVTVNKIYMGILATITAVCLVLVVLMLFNVFDYNNFSNLKEVRAENFTSQIITGKHSTSYYVLIYDKDNPENELIEDMIVKYANFAKGDHDAYPIFVLEYNSANASIIESKLSSTFNSETGLPCLVTISSGSVSNPKTTVSTILQLLEDSMNG